MILAIAAVVTVVYVAVARHGENEVRRDVSRAVPQIERVLNRDGERIAAAYPILAMSDGLRSFFGAVEGATLVASTQIPESHNAVRLAFEASSWPAARCVRFTVDPDGSFDHDVVGGDCN